MARLCPPRFRPLLAALLLGVAAAVPYINSLTGPWLLDDYPLIAANPHVTDPEQWRQLWVSDYWQVTGAPSGLYRPLTMSTYALTWAVAGEATWAYHFANVLLHVVVTLLVWRVGMGAGTGVPALGGALFFALHPVHADAVAGIVGRAELMVALFFLLALWSHRRAQEIASLRGRIKWRAALAASLLAMLLSKESGIPLLLYFPLEDLARRRARLEAQGWRRLATDYLILLMAVAVYLALRFQAVQELPKLAGRLGDAEHVTLTLSAAGKNLALLLGLGGHRAVWSVPELSEVGMPTLAAGAAAIALMAGAVVWALRSGSTAALGAGLTALGVLPLLHLVPNVIWVWERGLYAATIGLSWMVYAGLIWLSNRGSLSRPVIVLMLAGLVLGPGWRTHRWSALYGSELKFWAHEYREDPDRVENALSYSEALLKHGRRSEAVAIRREALKTHPRSGMLHSALVSALASSGLVEEAQHVLRVAAAVPLEFVSHTQRRQGLSILARQAEALRLSYLAAHFRRASQQISERGTASP